MTVETSIFETLKGLVSNRVYPDVAADGAPKPYIVYQQAGGVAPTFVERSQPSRKNGRFQVTVWATDRKTAAALGLEVERLMVESVAFQASPLGASVALYEQETELRGARQDFSVWSAR